MNYMKNFKFFDENIINVSDWTGATWFWEGANFDGALSIDQTDNEWVLYTHHCENGLLEFLRLFPENSIIPIKSIKYRDIFFGAEHDAGYPRFFPEMLTDEIYVNYWRTIR